MSKKQQEEIPGFEDCLNKFYYITPGRRRNKERSRTGRGRTASLHPNPNYPSFNRLVDNGAPFYVQLGKPDLRFILVTDPCLDIVQAGGFWENLMHLGTIDGKTKFLAWFQRSKGKKIQYPDPGDIIIIMGPRRVIHHYENYLSPSTVVSVPNAVYNQQEQELLTCKVESWNRISNHATGYTILELV